MKLRDLRIFCRRTRNIKFRVGLRLLLGSLVIIGSVSSSAAFPGDLDPTFGNGGKVLTDVGNNTELAMSSAQQADGKLVVAGYIYTDSGSDLVVVRYNADGTLDTTFGVGGKVITDTGRGSFDKANSVAIQPDGKIVAAGNTMVPNPNFIISDFTVVRYNPDGSLDTSFSSDGIVITRLGEFVSGHSNSVKIQADGKIVVAGEKSSAGVIEYESADIYTFAVARYNPDGSLDTTFDGDGLVFTNITEVADDATSAVIQPDGKIVVAGHDSQFRNDTLVTSRNLLVRYNSDGSLDPTFGSGGIVITALPPGFEQITLNQIALQLDGKIVGTGSIAPAQPAGYSFLVTRYNQNGSLDTSFDNDGFVVTSIRSFNTASSVAIQRNGKIVAAGLVSEDSPFRDIAAVRLRPDGSLDSGFGSGGKVVTSFGNETENYAHSVVIQPDGKIILVGGSRNSADNRSYFALARYQGDSINSGRPLFDFDGDGKTDLSVLRPAAASQWWYQRSSDGQVGVTEFGNPSDRIAPADYDGDGKTDIAVFRPADGTWWILRSSDNSHFAVQFGQSGDFPRPGDFDGDGKADFSVFRPSDGTWYRRNSSNNQFAAIRFGLNGDAPLIADFDGDGKSDIAVWRPSDGFWYWLNSSSGNFSAVQFGLATDNPAVGDFDGDGRTDVSVFRPQTGTWYRLNSSNDQLVITQFGAAADVAAVGDYDGDGKSDLAVWRPSEEIWYWLNSGSGEFNARQFGLLGDKPVPSAFLPCSTVFISCSPRP